MPVYLNTTENIRRELSERDSVLTVLIDKYGDISKTLESNYFESLASSIVGQQLSNRVADVIWNRLVKLLRQSPASGEGISPESVLEATAEDLRAAGLSFNKIAYLKNLSQAVVDGSLLLDGLQEMADEDVILQLTKIKGIGRWTAEMFLIFSLGRQDVFSLGDGGLYSALKRLYGVEELSKTECRELTEKWAPYRTFASLYLWMSLDNG